MSHGFARVRCGDCAFERLVPFSCKGRAICPSCGGRRMAERAAHLVDHVLPADVPVRQWVLSVPHRLRYRLAYDHRLCRTVLHVFVRALRSACRRAARRRGLAGGETGMVTSVQRFGGAVNVHGGSLERGADARANSNKREGIMGTYSTTSSTPFIPFSRWLSKTRSFLSQ